MGLLKDRDKKTIKKEFAKLPEPVKLIMFTQAMECQFCHETRELMEEVAALSDKLSVEVYDFIKDKERVLHYGIDKIPATVVEGKKDYGIRFFGIPSGYEFPSLMEAVLRVSTGESGLSDKTKALVKTINTPVHIQVFATPT